MPALPKVLVFAGSTRVGSYNKKLAVIAAEAARNAGGDVTYIDLRDLPMPLYDGDLEEASGLPQNARRFKDLLLANQGMVIASPEYNSSITAVLKNAIDWASRPSPGEKPLECFQGKVAALLSASPGALGGLRGLLVVRMMLGNIGTIVLPTQIAIAKAQEAFDENGRLKDDRQEVAVQRLMTEFVRTLSRLHA
jgi:chromate reductase, NAD(P)H dehydrogenase (quinone)